MVDYLIVTFIREEHEAVQHYFRESEHKIISDNPGSTRVMSMLTESGQTVKVAIARITKMGNITALMDVLNLIKEQQPKLVLAVGIAGAVPTNDIFLGDVLLVNEIHDMSLGAETEEGREESIASSHLKPVVNKFTVSVIDLDFEAWRNQATRIERPKVGGIDDVDTEDKEWIEKIKKTLLENGERPKPKIVDGAIASSDQLVKSVGFMKQRLSSSRDILANDMESAGVAKACEEKNTPLLIVRAISDIVGYKRGDDWKLYACKIAASCARELVNLDAVNTIQSKLHNNHPGLSESTENVIKSLGKILNDISLGESEVSTCREAFDLFKLIPEELKKKYAPDLFDTLDKPMKSLGDKNLVLAVAKECIACCHNAGSFETAECEGRARICGTSWVYQRTGRLDLAAHEAQKSLEISKKIESNKNIAFCNKCLGRLQRKRAETKKNITIKQEFFKESEAYLKKAISNFKNLPRYGDYSSEVGDCYSLLGRTYLSMGEIHLANEYAAKARQLIDGTSKDYLDLCILEGDIKEASKNHEEALEAFEEVINLTFKQDYQVSEIVARAYYQKGKTLMKMNKKENAAIAFGEAQKIWEHYEESDLAYKAEWNGIIAKGILIAERNIRLLEKEEPSVRCEVVRLYEERRSNRSRGSIAQRRDVNNRIGIDDIVLKKLVKEVENRQIREPQSD